MCNPSCLSFVERSLTPAEVMGLDVLEVGAHEIEGSPRHIVTALRPRSYVGVDLQAGPGVDEILDATGLVERYGPDAFDVVLSTEMIEHIRDWRTALSNLKAVLRPGGVMVVTTRSRGFAYHGFPADYWRYERGDFERIFDDLLIEALEDDSLSPGVFVKARKPEAFSESNLGDVALYSILAKRRVVDLSRSEERLYLWVHRATDASFSALQRWLPKSVRTALRRIWVRLGHQAGETGSRHERG